MQTRHSIRNSLFLQLCLLLLIIFLFALYAAKNQGDTLKTIFTQRGEQQTRFLAETLTPENSQGLIQSTLSRGKITEILIVDDSGNIEKQFGSRQSEHKLDLKIPDNQQTSILRNRYTTTFVQRLQHYTLDADKPYWIAVSYPTTQLFIEIARQYVITALIFMLFAVLILIIVISERRRYNNNLDKIRDTIESITKEEHTDLLILSDDKHTATLANAVNTMAQKISTMFKTMRDDVNETTHKLRGSLGTIEIQNIELDLARREALKASASKSEFIANTSHEIRTPLNGIIGFTKLLGNTSLTDQQQDYVTIIHRSAINLLDTINDILDFSKIDAGKLALDSTSFNLRALFDDVLDIVVPQAIEKQLEIILLFPATIPQQLIGDPLRLRQIVTNLVNNAVKFSDQGKIIIEISEEHRQHDTIQLRLTVKDNGIGLTEAEQRLIFNAFAQADTSTTRKYGGTGLGLIIVKRLVELMSGNVGLESKPGEGSEFWCTLLLKIDPQARLQVQNKNPIHLGLYDNREIVRESLQQTLHPLNAQITPYSQWDEAITALQSKDCDWNAFIFSLDQHQNEAWQEIIIQRPPCPIIILSNSANHSRPNHPDVYWLTRPISQHKITSLLSSEVVTHADSISDSTALNKQDKLNILIVDDNSANLKLLSALLTDLPVIIHTAENGQSAIDVCMQQTFELIFMDLRMPVIDGIEASKRIRNSNSKNRNTPIIAVTAHLAKEQERMLQTLGIDKYLAKPIDTEQVRKIINDLTHTQFIPNTQDHMTKPTPSVNAPSVNAPSHPVSIDGCLKKANFNKILAKDFLQKLIDSLPEEIQKLTASHNNHDELLEHCHKLHGACCYTGVPILKQNLATLEKSLLADKPERIIHAEIENCQNAMAELIDWEKNHDLSLLFAEE